METTIFEKGRAGRRSAVPPKLNRDGTGSGSASNPEVHSLESIPEDMRRKSPLCLPEVNELELVRHYTKVSQLNHSIDTGFYPLGSCTMKYNPKINDEIARLAGFAEAHPMWPESLCQPLLQICWELEELLCQITGVSNFSLQPSAGAHGELTGMLIIRAYHIEAGQNKTTVLIPDSAHGTNPSSAAMCGYRVKEVKSNKRGMVDLDDLKRACDSDSAALMLTNPNTLGIFEEDILEIADIVHSKGGLLYYDGANLNALLGKCRPGDMGFDVVHLNLHKSFSTPHGGGGPGAGPVGVKSELERFLPVPRIVNYAAATQQEDKFHLDFDRPSTIGKVGTFYGNIGVLIRAYVYIRMLGYEGLKRTGEAAVLNANYLFKKMKGHFDRKLNLNHEDIEYDTQPMHEFVLSAARQKREKGATALHIAKRIMDYGYHPPTVYFPLIVREAMMIEPTETETLETLDAFAEAMIKIAQEVESDPELVRSAPHNAPIGRLDDTKAVKEPVVRWKPKDD